MQDSAPTDAEQMAAAGGEQVGSALDAESAAAAIDAAATLPVSEAIYFSGNANLSDFFGADPMLQEFSLAFAAGASRVGERNRRRAGGRVQADHGGGGFGPARVVVGDRTADNDQGGDDQQHGNKATGHASLLSAETESGQTARLVASLARRDTGPPPTPGYEVRTPWSRGPYPAPLPHAGTCPMPASRIPHCLSSL